MFGKRNQLDTDQIDALAITLGGVAFFDGFSPTELGRVAQLAEEVDAEKGALLIDQGRVGTECFVILDGEAGVYFGGEHIATLGPGSMVGEMALVEHRPRNASVLAETSMKLIAFDMRSFKTLLQEMPEVHRRVMATLVERVNRNTGAASDRAAAEGDPDGPASEDLGPVDAG
ncbi:MAG: cyclic nucleotide-binding domain-containing protein [Actinobacteria bacterium]|nr:cyclic nucleotide-binding domain-containing protein [Actinomycetota bacterium]